MLRTVAATAVVAFGVVSIFALGEWDVDFNTPYRARVAAAKELPPGSLVAIDAAAWRWITGREVVVAPADGPRTASCAAEVYLATTLVLEPAHFTAYEDVYATHRSEFFTWRGDHDGIRYFAVREDQRCIFAARP